MKATRYFHNKILSALNTKGHRSDFVEMNSVINLYKNLTDDEKTTFSDAMAKILEHKNTDKGVLADLIDVAIALQIESIVENVEALKFRPCYSDPMLQIAVNNYLNISKNNYFQREDFYKKPWNPCMIP